MVKVFVMLLCMEGSEGAYLDLSYGNTTSIEMMPPLENDRFIKNVRSSIESIKFIYRKSFCGIKKGLWENIIHGHTYYEIGLSVNYASPRAVASIICRNKKETRTRGRMHSSIVFKHTTGKMSSKNYVLGTSELSEKYLHTAPA
jgi:hypothetical protein